MMANDGPLKDPKENLTTTQIATVMNTTVSPTSGIISDAPQDGATSEMTFVFLGAVAGTMIMLLAATFWAWRKDQREKKMTGITVIPQQSLHRCPQHYLLMLYTGSGRHSATTSNVFCRIYGNHHKTKPIVLRDPDREMFQPSSISSFLLTLNRSLNQIREIHVWHDISGPDPSWFLESVIICHLNTNITWYFEANRWLDVSTGSKEVDCKLQPLKRKTILGVKTTFDSKIVDNVKNKHLWFSPLFKHNRRTFSKFHKMSCCFAVAGITLLTTTWLVDKTQLLFPNTSIRVGPWKLSHGDFFRALVCSGIAFVYRLLLETLFVNSARNSALENNDRDVQDHIQENLAKANEILFLDETGENNGTDCTSNTEKENTPNSYQDIVSIELEFASSEELQEEHEDAADDTTESGSDNLKPMETSREDHSLNEAHILEELIDILGNFPEKQEVIQILDENSSSSPCSQSGESLAEDHSLEGHESENKTSKEHPDNFPDGMDSGVKTKVDRPESVCWTATVTNPDKIPKLWKNLPFPKHLISDDNIKKLHHDESPKFPQIVLNITLAQCFVLPFIFTVVAIAIGFHWPDSFTKSWLATFGVAIICEVFVVETFYMFLHAIYFAIWRQRPVKEEDLIDVLSGKVWVNEEQNTKYYVDVVDEEEGELVPRPPTVEDIQKAQENAGRERELEDVLKMLLFDILFIALLTFISFGNRDASAYPVRVGLEKSFNVSKSFYNGVNNTETLWKWLANDTIPVLLYEPSGTTLPKDGKRFLADGNSFVLGTAILRQQRIKPGANCKIPDVAKHVFSGCEPEFLTGSNGDTDTYQPGWKKTTATELNDTFSSPWRYMSGEESNTDYNTWGRRRNSFSGGGYIAYLGTDKKSTLGLIYSLKAHGWIDDLTRVVFLEFSIYNANVNILSALIFSIEFSSFGGAFPRLDVYLFRLYRYFTPLQFLYLVAEIVFVVFVAQLIYRVGHLIHRDRWDYFKSFWNITDLLLILFSLITIALYVVRESHLNSAIVAIRENPETFYGFLNVAFYDDYIAYFSCLIVLIPTFQFLKFLKFNKSFMIFYSTLARIRGDISGFAFVFFVSMMCFTYWAYTMLITVAEVFSTFIGTFYSMIAMLLGKFSFRLLAPGQAITATVGPIFTYAFTCANVFLILNIILTIITIGFKESREDDLLQQSEYEIIKFIVTFFKGALGLLPPYIPPPPEIKPPAKEKHFTYFQWKLCTSYVTGSQCPRLLNFANDSYLEDFADELEMVANLLSMPQSRRFLYEITRREQGF